MFPQFGATAESLSRASSLVFRIGTDAHLYDDPDDVSIAPLLDSSFDSEKAEALKRLLALIAQGEDVSNFFPQVVKNVASPSLELKKLVYLYLLHYAERRPNEALLSINCFQKDLSDPNPLVRAWALRAMSGIRLHVISPLVLVALSKCAKDPSSYVRKCAANALPKLSDLHQEENASALEELVGILLSDHSPGVVGAAAAAFNYVCPNNLSLIERNFRRLCETLPDVDEWGQIALIDILLRYVVARHGLAETSIMVSSLPIDTSHSKKESFLGLLPYDRPVGIEVESCDPKLSACMFKHYIQESEEYLSKLIGTKGNDNGLNSAVLASTENSDVKLLLKCTSPLLWSQNSSVVLAAAGVHWVLASQMDVDGIVKPILFILRSSYASRYVVLRNVQVFAKAMPSLFAPYYEDFFVSSSDPYQMRALKLEILSAIVTDSSIPFILQEFQDYIKDPDRRFAVDAVAAIALCAQKIPSVAKTCLEGLLALISQESSISHCGSLEGEAGVLVQAIMSVKAIIKQDPANYEKVIVHLIGKLDKIREPSARALIIWIMGEYNYVGQLMSKIVPVVLGHLAQCFASEELEAKHQMLTTLAKVVLHAQGEELEFFRKVLGYILELARFDVNYDIRDRARMMGKLLTLQTIISHQDRGILNVEPNGELLDKLVKNIFFEKIQPISHSINNLGLYLPGSLSQIVLHAAPGYRPLPKPCMLPEMAVEERMSQDGSVDSNSEDVTEPVMLSDSSTEDSNSNYDSEGSFISSLDGAKADPVTDSDDVGHNTLQIGNGTPDTSETGQLMNHIDASINYSQSTEKSDVTSLTTDLASLMSKTTLESWLNEQPSMPSLSSSTGASARISINEIGITVRPKAHIVLESANGKGLRVGYLFPSEFSKISPFLVCVEVFFENLSSEPLKNVTVRDEASAENPEFSNQAFGRLDGLLDPDHVPTLVPMEEIASLNPGEIARRIIQVRFHHHLLPLKLAVFCNEGRHPIKLQPDIGYFVRPLSMDMDSFTKRESQLRGMFEYTRRCTFTDHIEVAGHEEQDSLNVDNILAICQKIASKMLSNANIHLVSVDMPVSLKFGEVSGLCLRFSSEILNSLKPCLITLFAEGRCSEPLDVSVKINCDETVFGLNLLNRIVAFLTSDATSM